jgi:hypothetical protein
MKVVSDGIRSVTYVSYRPIDAILLRNWVLVRPDVAKPSFAHRTSVHWPVTPEAVKLELCTYLIWVSYLIYFFCCVTGIHVYVRSYYRARVSDLFSQRAATVIVNWIAGRTCKIQRKRNYYANWLRCL